MTSAFTISVYDDAPQISNAQFKIVAVFGSMTDALQYTSQFKSDPKRRKPRYIEVIDTLYDAPVRYFLNFVESELKQIIGKENIHPTFPDPHDTTQAAEKFWESYNLASHDLDPENYLTDEEYQEAIFREMRYQDLYQEYADKATEKDYDYSVLLGFNTGPNTRIAISKVDYVKARRY